MTEYVLVGAIVAVVMLIGLWVSHRSEKVASAYAATCCAVAVSVVAWMALSEPLQLSDSTPAVMAIGVEIIVLAAVSVSLHRNAHPRRNG